MQLNKWRSIEARWPIILQSASQQQYIWSLITRYFHKIVWWFYFNEVSIAAFLPASPFISTSPFINFGDFCQPVHLLHPPRLLFWSKFVSLPVYSVLLFYLKLKNNLKTVNFKILTIKSFQRLHHVQPNFDLLFLKLKVISATKLFFAVK